MWQHPKLKLDKFQKFNKSMIFPMCDTLLTMKEVWVFEKKIGIMSTGLQQNIWPKD